MNEADAAVATPTAPATTSPAEEPKGELGVRIVGALWVLIFGAAFALIAISAFKSDFGTTNTRLRLLIRAATFLLLYPAVLGGLAAATGKQPPSSSNPLAIPFAPRWYNTLSVLWGREVKSLFTTGVPYAVYAAYLGLNGFLFVLLVWYYSGGAADYRTPPGQLLVDNIFFWLCMWFICPALSMRLIAEEKRLGTFETLLTAPVTDLQVVLSKFLGVFVFFITMVATSLPYFIFLSSGSRDWDWGPVMGALLGIVLLGGLYLAIGLFASSLTKDQVVAFMIAMVFNIMSFFVNAFSSFVKDQTYDLFGPVKLNFNKICTFASVHTQFQDLTLGIVSTTPVIYFVSLIAFFLFLAVRGLEAQKWR